MKVSKVANALVGGLPGISCDAGAIQKVADATRDRVDWVVAIEPNPEVFRRLSASIAVKGFTARTNAQNVAVAGPGETGERAFFVPTGEPKNGRFVGAQESAEYLANHGTVTEVELGRIDPAAFDWVDFVKIDVEGAELAVLEHLRPVLEKFRPKVVCEVNFQRGYGWDDVVAAFGTDRLSHLDFHSKVKPLTREMAETQQLGEDWLVCVDFTRVAMHRKGRSGGRGMKTRNAKALSRNPERAKAASIDAGTMQVQSLANHHD